MTTPAEKLEMARRLEDQIEDPVRISGSIVFIEADVISAAAALREAADEQERHASIVEHLENRIRADQETIHSLAERAQEMREALADQIRSAAHGVGLRPDVIAMRTVAELARDYGCPRARAILGTKGGE
jgi:hypothetical protein